MSRYHLKRFEDEIRSFATTDHEGERTELEILFFLKEKRSILERLSKDYELFCQEEGITDYENQPMDGYRECLYEANIFQEIWPEDFQDDEKE